MSNSFVQSAVRLGVAALGGNTFVDIPLMSIIPQDNSEDKDTTNNSNVDSTGNLNKDGEVTARGRAYDCKTTRIKDATTPANLHAALAQIEAAGEKTGAGAKLDFQLTTPGVATPETFTARVSKFKPFGDAVTDVSQFEFTITKCGANS